MIETIIVILLALWALGYFVAHLGDIMHFLLLVALAVFIYRMIRRR